MTSAASRAAPWRHSAMTATFVSRSRKPAGQGEASTRSTSGTSCQPARFGGASTTPAHGSRGLATRCRRQREPACRRTAHRPWHPRRARRGDPRRRLRPPDRWCPLPGGRRERSGLTHAANLSAAKVDRQDRLAGCLIHQGPIVSRPGRQAARRLHQAGPTKRGRAADRAITCMRAKVCWNLFEHRSGTSWCRTPGLALSGRLSVLHRDLLLVLHIALCLALDAVGVGRHRSVASFFRLIAPVAVTAPRLARRSR